MGKVFSAKAPYRTRQYGLYTIMTTNPKVVGGQHIVLTRGNLYGKSNIVCRVSSSCVTSTALNSNDCDCAVQLDAAFGVISSEDVGVLIYLDQEGRGHGLEVKVHAMNKKFDGFDTFDAVETLGLSADVRTYDAVKIVLDELGVKSIRLLSNNPDKVAAIRAIGVVISEIIPCLGVSPPEGSRRHLEAKIRRGHIALKRTVF